MTMIPELSSNLKVLYKDLRILYSHDTRKFGKKMLLQNYVPFSLISWHLSGQIMPGGGDFVSFSRPGGLSFVLKSCPRDGDFDRKK